MSNPSFAEFMQHPAVTGVSVGVCVERGVKDHRVAELDGVDAHAHHDPSDKHFGWICVSSIEDLGSKFHVSRTLMHELAHLIAKAGHNDRWRKKMHALGQPIPARYQKRSRVRHAS